MDEEDSDAHTVNEDGEEYETVRFLMYLYLLTWPCQIVLWCFKGCLFFVVLITLVVPRIKPVTERTPLVYMPLTSSTDWLDPSLHVLCFDKSHN